LTSSSLKRDFNFRANPSSKAINHKNTYQSRNLAMFAGARRSLRDGCFSAQQNDKVSRQAQFFLKNRALEDYADF
jgi:hypothetical protein